MLASKLALTVLLVALGSALANPAESKVAEKREGDYRKVDTVIINQCKKKEDVYTLYGILKTNAKVVLLARVPAGKYFKLTVYPFKYYDIIGFIDRKLAGINTGEGFYQDAQAVAGKYRFAIVPVFLSPRLGYRVLLGVVYNKKRYYEEEGREAEDCDVRKREEEARR